MAEPVGVDWDGRLARSYEAGRSLSPDAEEAWAGTVEPHLRPGAVVVDVGAGTGRFARLFSRRFDARVVAVEPAAGMRAQRAVDGVGLGWLAGRAEALPVRDASVDLAWLSCVVHYVDLEATGSELGRVLRPAGRVLVRSAFPDRFDDLPWMRWFPRAREIDEARVPSVEAVAAAFGSAGLRLQDRVALGQRMATDLHDLGDRLAHRAISTLELLSDEEFAAGLEALRRDADRLPRRPVHSVIDTLVFARA
jgi:SAM-dependent methyltransferase